MHARRSSGLLRAGSPPAAFRLLTPLLVTAGLAAPGARAAAVDDVVDTISVEELAELMEGEGYAVEVNNDRFVQWKVDGYRCQVFVADDSQAVQFHVSFSDGNATLKKVNEWNKRRRYSRSYLDKDGDPVLELDLGMSGGVTVDRIKEFFKTCRASYQAWCVEVIK